MKYKLRKGVVLESICGTSLLIATIDARKHCPYVMELNDASLFIVKGILEKKSIEEMAILASEQFLVKKEDAIQIIHSFINQLNENHYLEEEE